MLPRVVVLCRAVLFRSSLKGSFGSGGYFGFVVAAVVFFWGGGSTIPDDGVFFHRHH